MREKWAKVLGEKSVKSQQAIIGRALQIGKAGYQYAYALRRLSSAKPLDMTIKRLKEMERCSGENKFLRASVTSEENRDEQGLPILQYRTFSDPDFGGGCGGASIASAATSVNGAMIELTSDKQALARQSVAEAELSASCVASKAAESHMLFAEELGLTQPHNLLEAQFADNSSSIEISVGKTLSKRGKSPRTRELGLRAKVQAPVSSFQYSVGKIDALKNPTNGGTKALCYSEWEEFKRFIDILNVELADPEDLSEIPRKYGRIMGECESSESRFRRGHYK